MKMKKMFYPLAALLFVGAAVGGCNQSTLDDMTGKYAVPVTYTLNSLAGMSIETVAKPLRRVSLELTGNGGTLVGGFITNDYYLKAGAYAKGGDTPSNGTWLPGVTTFNSRPVVGGTINVGLTGTDQYTVSGVLQLSVTETVIVDFSGQIVFPEEPPVVTYSWEKAGPYSYTEDGQNYTTVEGSQVSRITVLADGMKRAYFEIVGPASATSLAGIYPVRASITDASGAVVRGQYIDLVAVGWGTDIIKSGSYLFDGATEQFLFDGTLTITESAEGVSFSSTDFVILDTTSSFMAPAPLPGTVSISLKNGTMQ